MNFIRNRNFRAGPQTSLEGFICHQNSDKQQKIKVFGRSVGGRISYIDALKGLLIILVIIGHSNVNLIVPRAVQAIYTVHMPLFFILSGFFLHRNEAIKNQFKKSLKNYVVPYVLTCLVGIALILAKWYLTQDMKYEL